MGWQSANYAYTKLDHEHSIIRCMTVVNSHSLAVSANSKCRECFTVSWKRVVSLQRWRRNCSGFGRYTFQPYINIHSPYFTVLWLSSLLDAISLENDNEVVFGMHEIWWHYTLLEKKQLYFCYVLVRAFEKNRCHSRNLWKNRHGLHTYNFLPTPLHCCGCETSFHSMIALTASSWFDSAWSLWAWIFGQVCTIGWCDNDVSHTILSATLQSTHVNFTNFPRCSPACNEVLSTCDLLDFHSHRGDKAIFFLIYFLLSGSYFVGYGFTF